jgi:hypothetical protein
LLLLAPVWPASLPVLVGVILLYFLILLAASLTAAISGRDLRLLAGIPAAIAVMHLSWGSGFLWSALQRHPRTEKIA